MDLVHHLIFKENVLGTDFQKTDNGQNPVLGKCNVPLSEPFKTEVNLHHLSYIIHTHTHIHTMFPCVTALAQVVSS